MVDLGTARLAGFIMVVCITAIAGANLAFAQTSNSTSTTPPLCGEQPYASAACGPPLNVAQMYGAITVAGVVIASVITAAASGNLKH
jgi:hypothetical protein